MHTHTLRIQPRRQRAPLFWGHGHHEQEHRYTLYSWLSLSHTSIVLRSLKPTITSAFPREERGGSWVGHVPTWAPSRPFPLLVPTCGFAF